MQSSTSVPLGEFRLLALRRAIAEVSSLERTQHAEDTFEKRELSPILVTASARELLEQLEATAARLADAQRAAASRILRCARDLVAARTATDALNVYHDLLSLPDVESGAQFKANRLAVEVSIPDTNSNGYLAAVAELFSGARTSQRPLTRAEHAAIDIADWRLLSATPLRTPFACLGTSGFRPIQTWLSLADPGPDHVRITAATETVLRGLVVHVEHIDRDMIEDKETLEPYRLPAAWHAGRVRLRIGDAVPCTAFIGRPIFENRQATGTVSERVFRIDLLKTVHLHASACTAMFMSGIADCKVAIERMTTSCAKAFMRALAGNAFREIGRQTLSAAFNINTPIEIDDDGEPRTETDPFAIARKGIDLAVAGGFEKVTWDGASNEVPSRPFVEQLSHEQLVELVHLAHERGLETYISAGMVAHHMEHAVLAGVDGVGIGTSMHWIDPATKLMGALKPLAIEEALRVRDMAAATTLGRAAALLARLDQMHFEGALLPKEEAIRGKLYAAVRLRDEAEAARCDNELGRIKAIPHVPLGENPVLARGRRRLERERIGRVDRSAEDDKALEEALNANDVPTIQALLRD